MQTLPKIGEILKNMAQVTKWNTCNVDSFDTVDGESPVIENCPADIFDTTPLGSPGKTITWVAPTATDNSGVATLASVTSTPGQFFLVGTTEVVYRFVDPTGNEAFCRFNVDIVEGKIFEISKGQRFFSLIWMCHPYNTGLNFITKEVK